MISKFYDVKFIRCCKRTYVDKIGYILGCWNIIATNHNIHGKFAMIFKTIVKLLIGSQSLPKFLQSDIEH